ncbi:LacI family DNA-binding transcriptional regulator [Gryllotalpicola reticulitermitis]|uniref:LacI family DNA-binding transcriptional regulator n=1 Tax=Gryllotalpicola reticulitermitis TaxID=1184153 RepID=A0ABV8Q1J9_9MICO
MPATTGGRSTIEDVARLARVSRTTVSNFLNGRDARMNDETRLRIRSAMDALSYVPLASARQLRTGHAEIIGVIVPSVANPFWGEFVRAAEEGALAAGFGVLVGSSERLAERERTHAEAMYRQGIRAVIFGSSPLSIGHIVPLAERGLSVVAFDREFHGGDIPNIEWATVDNRLGARLATGHLLELGHRRIGFLSGPIRTASRRDRLDGYRDALGAAGLSFDGSLVWEGSQSSAFGDDEGAALGALGARQLAELPEPPTALVCINDMYAIGAMTGLEHAGLSVPDDVSVIGFDDIPLASYTRPALTTIRQPVAAMARAAVDVLIRRLRAEPPPTDFRHVYEPELVVRASTSPTHPHQELE